MISQLTIENLSASAFGVYAFVAGLFFCGGWRTCENLLKIVDLLMDWLLKKFPKRKV